MKKVNACGLKHHLMESSVDGNRSDLKRLMWKNNRYSNRYSRTTNITCCGGTYPLVGLTNRAQLNITRPISFSTLLINGLPQDENATISWSGLGDNTQGMRLWRIESGYQFGLKSGKDWFFPVQLIHPVQTR
jgi:hypothetical protein